MKIVSACIYPLNIPFVESFSHALSDRNHSDSIVVELTTDSGVSGFGEAVPRPYVTGETRDGCVNHLRDALLPHVIGARLDGISTNESLAALNRLIPESPNEGAVVWNAARGAVELALIDVFLRSVSQPLSTVLPPATPTVTYSAVISAGPLAKVEKMAQRCKLAGFQYVKQKVSGAHDVESVKCVRDILGPAVSIRLDANAAFTQEAAVQFIESVSPYQIACIEQPIPRGSIPDLATVRKASAIPIMADESIVTMHDAEALIEAHAVDYFNLRLSKCGGLRQTLAIAQVAGTAGIGIQVGCQVGETAILSAAGRHLAATLPKVCFVEGSYSTYLLEADISDDAIVFGDRGEAPVLTGPGLGITVNKERLNKFSKKKVAISHIAEEQPKG